MNEDNKDVSVDNTLITRIILRHKDYDCSYCNNMESSVLFTNWSLCQYIIA